MPKNPHAVALGRLGGLKGGPARAKKLSKKKRSEIAQKAAKSRWSKPIKGGMRTTRSPSKKTTAKRKTIKKKQEDTQQPTYTREGTFDPNLTRLPISIGVDKVWYIKITEEFKDGDIIKFTQMIQLALIGEIK